MLVCPQCQFENPNNNKFCQRCGTSLVDRPCQKCGTSVSFSAETCHNCGAFTGTIWLAIIAEQGEHKQKKNGEYLDLGRRYRLMSSDRNPLTPLNISTSSRQFFQGKVVDCQPLQKSVLGILLEQQAELLDNSGDLLEKEATLWLRIGIPELARPYLTLQEFSPAIPTIHDAWQEENKEVILLGDRSEWQLLTHSWQEGKIALTVAVAWFKEMAALWEILSQDECNQSLLVENNLRVSQEQTFGLKQLYPNPPDTQPKLTDLGQLWQKLLQPSELRNFEPIAQLLEKLANGAIATVEQLLSQLQELTIQQPTEASRVRQTTIQLSARSVSSSDEPITERLVLVPSQEDSDNFDSGSMRSIGQMTEGEDLSTAFLPMELLNLVDAGCTDRGRARHHNEDFFGMRSQVKKQQSSRSKKFHARGLYIVCDGMGGHAAGEVASAMAVEALQRYFIANWQENLPDRETIEKGVLLANQTIFNVNQKNARSGNGRMGTTLVMTLVQDNKIAIAHVGDSRIYRVSRKGGLEQLTVDHEVGQKAIQGGIAPEIAYARPDAYQLTQALGPHASKFIQPDVRFLDLQEDTLLLLCSDGMSDNYLLETHWQTYLTPLISSSNNLEKGLRKLIDFANQHNGHDNITAILVRMKIRPYLGGGN